MKAYIEQLMDYNYWANGLILKFVEKLPPKAFTEELSEDGSSIRDILAHIMFAEWLWLDRMNGLTLAVDEVRKKYNPERCPNLKSLYGDWFALELRMREYLAGLTEKQIGETFKYFRQDGEEFQNCYIDVFTQLVLHGMQHRSELAVILTDKGFSPGNIDYIAYLRP